MQAKDWIALTAVVVAPLAALAGAWLNGHMSARQRAADESAKAREDALHGLAGMWSLLLDAQPSLILDDELREYDKAPDALRGLYGRWLQAREPLVTLSLTLPQPEARDLALNLQAQVEMVLRRTEDAYKQAQPDARPEASQASAREAAVESWKEAAATARRLGELLSPFGSSSFPSPAWLDRV